MTRRAIRKPEPTDAAHWRLEVDSMESEPTQLPLLAPGETSGRFTELLGVLPALEPTSSFDLARAWFERDLKAARHPENTVKSYLYDLVILEKAIGSKPINEIQAKDIGHLLGTADNRSTRKRRLTSVRQFFGYLTSVAKVLDDDPCEGFYPHAIQLKSPILLFENELTALLDAAAEDEPWSLTAIWLMLRLGLTRQELLNLRRDDIDLSTPGKPVVNVVYDDPGKRGKERRLAGDEEFERVYLDYLDRRPVIDLLVPYGFQAVNEMVSRVTAAAEIRKHVTPQVLRHAFAIERAKRGADEKQLLALLGLADDPRNRESVRRYLKLAAPPL